MVYNEVLVVRGLSIFKHRTCEQTVSELELIEQSKSVISDSDVELAEEVCGV